MLLCEECMVFFINLYNVFVIYGMCVFGMFKNMFERLDFFFKVSYDVVGVVYMCDDIENGILCGN